MQGMVRLLQTVGTRCTRSLVRGHGVPVLMAGTIALAGLGAALTSLPAQGAADQTTVVQPHIYYVDGWSGHRHHHNDGDMDDQGFSDPYGTYPAKPNVDSNFYVTVPSQGYGGGNSGVDGYGNVNGNSPSDGYGYAGGNSPTYGNSALQGTTYIGGNGSAKGYGDPNGLGQ